MKVLIVSRYGDGADLAIDAKRDGHECRVWIQDPKRRHTIFEGLVDKVEKYQDAKGWADFVIFDANGLEKEWTDIQKWKVPVWGGSPEGNKMEKDREYAHGIMESAGMKPLKSDSYKTIEEAIKAIQGKKGLRVGKIVGGDADSEDVLISEMEDGSDIIALMERFADSGRKYESVEVEDRVIGVEMGCAGYFSGQDWEGPIELNWQFKEIASGWPGTERGLGALCGETGTVIRYVTKENAFFKKTLGLFTEHLRKVGYVGEFDVGTMTNEKGIYPIEFTPRFGYPDMFIRRALSKTPQIDFFHSVASGKPIPFDYAKGWSLGFLLMAPGFPYDEAVAKHSAGYPVFGYDEKNTGMHLQEVTMGKHGIEIAKGSGYAAVVSASGPTIQSAHRRAHWLVNEDNPSRLYIPKMAIRVDIGDRVLEQKDQILELGLMDEKEWSLS